MSAREDLIKVSGDMPHGALISHAPATGQDRGSTSVNQRRISALHEPSIQIGGESIGAPNNFAGTSFGNILHIGGELKDYTPRTKKNLMPESHQTSVGNISYL
jgi:hypothetical protein